MHFNFQKNAFLKGCTLQQYCTHLSRSKKQIKSEQMRWSTTDYKGCEKIGRIKKQIVSADQISSYRTISELLVLSFLVLQTKSETKSDEIKKVVHDFF